MLQENQGTLIYEAYSDIFSKVKYEGRPIFLPNPQYFRGEVSLSMIELENLPYCSVKSITKGMLSDAI